MDDDEDNDSSSRTPRRPEPSDEVQNYSISNGGSLGVIGAALSAAIDHDTEASPVKPLTIGMRAEIAALVLGIKDEQEMISAIDKLFIKEQTRCAREIERMRSRAHFTQSDLEKKMAMQRDASKTEGKHLIVQIERKHREEQSKLRRDLVELKQEYTQQLADQAAKAVEREAVLLQKLTDLDGGLAAKEYQRQQFIEHLYTSAARRLQNIELSRGFLAWTSWYMDHVQLKFAMARLFHMQLFHSWNTWVEFCQVRATQKRVMVAAAVRMMKPKLIAAYTHWRRDWELRCVQDEMDARVKELQNAMRTQREKFEQEFERLKAELRKAEERELENKNEELERVQYKAIRRMLNQQLSLGWTAWRTLWENTVYWKQGVSRAALRIRHRETLKAWEEWVAVYQQERWTRILRVATGRLRNIELAKGFATWADWSELERLNKVFIAAGLRLRHRDLFQGWDAWKEVWEDAVQKRRMVAVLTRMRMLDLVRAFEAWTEMWEQHTEQMLMLRNGLNKLLRPKLLASFTYWEEDWREELRSKALRPLPTWEEVEEREKGLETKIKALAEQLNAQLGVAKIAAQNSDAVIAQQSIAAEKLTKECEALRRLVQTGMDQIQQLRTDSEKRVAQKIKELKNANDEAAAMAMELASMREQLLAYGTPMSAQERRQILRSNLSDMKRQMQEITETAVDKHSESVRGLTNLVALRERQLVRASSTPRLTSARARPQSASVRSQLDNKPLQKQPPRAAASTTLGVAAGLFVSPACPEAGPKASELKQQLAAKLQTAVQRATALWGNHEAEDIDQVLYGRLYGGASMGRAQSDVTLGTRHDTSRQSMPHAVPDRPRALSRPWSASSSASLMRPGSARCSSPLPDEFAWLKSGQTKLSEASQP